jgi:hypothetical protein
MSLKDMAALPEPLGPIRTKGTILVVKDMGIIYD